MIRGAFQSPPVTPGVFTGDLRDLPKATPWQPGDPIYERPPLRITNPEALLRAPQPPAEPKLDPLLELQEGSRAPTTRAFDPPNLNFEGQSFTGSLPPDTVGDVGSQYYIQMVNHPSGSQFTIYRKNSEDDIAAGPTVLSTFWTAELHAENVTANEQFDAGEAIYVDNDSSYTVTIGDTLIQGPTQPVDTPLISFSYPELHAENVAANGQFDIGEAIYVDNDYSHTVTSGDTLIQGPTQPMDTPLISFSPCASGLGDPIVLFDQQAQRWLMSEFANFWITTGNHLCVYISRGSNPIYSGWYLYDFAVPEFPDYPKYAVWPDAYYVSTNESSPAAYALDRAKMLAGLPATFQRFTAPSLAGFAFQALTPSDGDGPNAPPTTSPNFFLRHRDDEMHNDPAVPSADFIEIWSFSVNWATPANSTFTGPVDVPVAEFDSTLCAGAGITPCIPQPGAGSLLHSLREVVMWRVQYRNFITHETLVGNFTTDVDGLDRAGIRWFELRRTPPGVGNWGLFQEGTYGPGSLHHWLGSIAMDGDGNMALGFSDSSETTNPGVRYVGRFAGDGVGTMPQGPVTCRDSPGVQSAGPRWGDYSSMNVDPVNDRTFWYTNEFIGSDGNWGTCIASFDFRHSVPVLPSWGLAVLALSILVAAAFCARLLHQRAVRRS